MPVTFEDDFYETIREFAIPPSSVSYVMQASLWSARNSRSGFAPAMVLADLTDDVVRDMGPLIAARIVKRARKGGMQVIEGRGITIVNASDIAERVTRDMAEADRKREEWNTRKRRQRDAEKAERQNRMAAGVTQKSRGKATDVTRDQTKTRKKPQVSGNDVPRDIGVTSRGTPQIDRSNQSSSGVSHINARAREDPAVIAVVVKTVATRVGRIIGADDASAAIGRAIARPKTPKRIHDPVSYFTAVFENEKDLYAELLCEPAELLEAALTAAPDPDRPDTDRHPYERDPRTGVCKCDNPKSNWRHQGQEEARPA